MSVLYGPAGEILSSAEMRVDALLNDLFYCDTLADRRPVVEALNELGVVACLGCGCTDAVACEGGCRWLARNLCSRCAPLDVAIDGGRDGWSPA